MILIAFVTCLLITVRRLRLPGRRMAIVSIGALSLLAVTGVALHDNVRVERTLARFDALKDGRPEIWEATWYAIGQHWPVEEGLGTFRPVFDAAVRLDLLRQSSDTLAHKAKLDYHHKAG